MINYFENTSHKTLVPVISTPIISTPHKNDKLEFFDDQVHNSCSKADVAFQMYCQQNLSPINNFPYMNKNHFINSPDTMKMQQNNQKGFKNVKSVFSPSFAQFSKFNPSSSMHGYNGNTIISSSMHGGEYVALRDDFDADYHQSFIPNKNITTPLQNKHFQPTILLNGNPMSNHPYKSFNSTHQAAIDNSNKYYVYQSPVFKINFNNKNQLDSDFNKEFIDEFAYQNCGNKSIIHKSQELEFQNRQGSYKRVIQFNDENDEEGCEQISNHQSNQKQIQKKNCDIIMKNQMKRSDAHYQSQQNIFEEFHGASTIFDSQNTQMTFNPSKNSQNSQNDNSTTVKKTIDFQYSVQDLKQTAWKQNQNRKLFESPQIEDRDLHTPSTKKKFSSFLISQHQPQFNNPSSKKKEDKIQEKKTSKKEKLLQKQQSEQNNEISQKEDHDLNEINKDPLFSKQLNDKDDEHEDIEEENEKSQNSSQHSPFVPFNAQNSYGKQQIISEDKKVCCNCKRTKCLKLYCECFAASKICEGCTCQGCFNKPEFESMIKDARNAILERNNSAFDPKIYNQNKAQQICNDEGVADEQKVHSKGCNCKKSNCLKKYCECFQLGVKCTKLCKCDNCKNNTNHPNNQNDEPDFRINATPSRQSFSSAGKMNLSHLSNSGVRLSQSEHSHYNLYKPNYQEYYHPYYQYPYGRHPYFRYYYMHSHDEQNENSNGVPINIQHPHPHLLLDQYGYESYNHPHLVHSAQYKESMKNVKKYSPQYAKQMSLQNTKYESNMYRKKGQKNNLICDEQSFENYSYYDMPHPEKKKKIMEEGSIIKKLIEENKYNELNLIEKENNEECSQPMNKEIFDLIGSKMSQSPRFKEASNHDFQDESQVSFKKDEQKPKQKESKKQKSQGENENKFLQFNKKKEEMNQCQNQFCKEDPKQQMKSQNNDILDDQGHQQNNQGEIQDDIEEIEVKNFKNNKLNEKNTSIKSEQANNNNIMQKTKKITKKNDDKKIQDTTLAQSNTQISRSPHNTRKNKKEQLEKEIDDKKKKEIQQKQKKQQKTISNKTQSCKEE